MPKTISIPEDMNRLTSSSEALADAEAEATQRREVYRDNPTQGNQRAWIDAIKAEGTAIHAWLEVHREYIHE